MLRYLRGYCELEITGASPEYSLNRLTRCNIPFWAMRRLDPFTLRLNIYQSHWPEAEREITNSLCVVKRLETRGLRCEIQGLRRRPVLTIGLFLVFLGVMLAQNWIWFLEIEGCDRLTEHEIRAALMEEGIGFGTWGPGIDTQYLKNRLLNRIPELRWCAVNPEGAIARVLVSERNPDPPKSPDYQIANVVAARDGVITDMSVFNGFPVVVPGEAVTEGQLLVSGFADWTTHTQATAASAEVEALTRHSYRLITPAEYGEKVYTGRTELCRTLIFQRKRIKISGNSSIFGTRCDKITEIKQIILPGSWELPIEMEISTLREYRLSACLLTAQDAEETFRTATYQMAESEMLAGIVDSAELSVTQTEDVCQGTAELFCREVISRTMPVYLFGKEEQHGETDQCREN